MLGHTHPFIACPSHWPDCKETHCTVKGRLVTPLLQEENAPWRWECPLLAPETAELSLTAHSPSASPYWKYLINPPMAGLILQWHLRREVLVIASHLEKAEQDRQKITQNLKEMRRRKSKTTGRWGKLARCYLTRQENRDKKTEQSNNTPVTTKNHEREQDSKYWLWWVAW